MNTNSKWMPATIALVVIALMTGMLEPVAFGKDPESTTSQEPAVEGTVARAAAQGAAATAAVPAVPLTPPPAFNVAQLATPQTPAATRSVLPSKTAAQQSKSSSKKWILIVAAAGAAGAAAILATRGDKIQDKTLTGVTPTIVVGSPNVSQP
jgi:hypothetical protein